jgi:hypothetical protein
MFLGFCRYVNGSGSCSSARMYAALSKRQDCRSVRGMKKKFRPTVKGVNHRKLLVRYSGLRSSSRPSRYKVNRHSTHHSPSATTFSHRLTYFLLPLVIASIRSTASSTSSGNISRRPINLILTPYCSSRSLSYQPTPHSE